MEEARLKYLINKYLQSTATVQELEELQAWYDEVDFGGEGFDNWIKEYNSEKELTDQMYQRFEGKKEKERARIIYLRRFYRASAIAATILIAFITAFLFKNVQRPISPKIQLVSRPIPPGGNKAILTLANGSKIELDDQKNGTIASQPGVTIVKNNTGKLIYKIAYQSSAAYSGPVTYNSISTPRGGEYQVVLPDGTQVWLNSESSLTYPTRFSGRERKVKITGEAYFEVVHNKDIPFHVDADGQDIEDLGTRFNIKAYRDENVISTTLIEGSVKVSNLISNKSRLLVPGQQANTTAANGNIAVQVVNTEQVISWKNGYFLFDNMGIASIMKVISRWYNIDVQYNGIDQKETFGGTFSKYQNLSDLLRNLETLGHVHFVTKNRKIIVSN